MVMTNKLKEKIETEHQKFRAQLTQYTQMAEEANQGLEILRGIIAPFKIILQNEDEVVVTCVKVASLLFNKSLTLILQHPSQVFLQRVLFSFSTHISLNVQSFCIYRIEYKTFMELLQRNAENIGGCMAILELLASDDP